ncbi:MAG: prepilin peptidase, partial [Bacteroidota bacterium]
MPTLFLQTSLFFLGTIVGSFLGVLIHRYKKNESGIIFGRSHCNYCQKKLAAKDLVPLASFILLKGRSRCCNKKIGKEYFFLEIITGILFGLLWIIFPDAPTFIFF